MPLGTPAGGAMPGPTLEPVQTAEAGVSRGGAAADGAQTTKPVLSAIATTRALTPRKLRPSPMVTARRETGRSPRVVAAPYQSSAVGASDRIKARTCVELLEDGLHVATNGRVRDTQLRGDRAVTQPGRHPRQ